MGLAFDGHSHKLGMFALFSELLHHLTQMSSGQKNSTIKMNSKRRNEKQL